MWTCPLCHESADNFDPEGHLHYFFHYLPPNDNVDWDYCGTLAEKGGIVSFVQTVVDLLTFDEVSSRYEAESSLDRAFSRLPTFPVKLRELLRTCLEHQIPAIGENGEGCDMGTLVPDLHEYVDKTLSLGARDLCTNSFFNPNDPNNDWDVPAWVYWAGDPETAALDCAQRLGVDLKHLKRLQLKGSKYKVVL